MPRRCDSCRHLGTLENPRTRKIGEICKSPTLPSDEIKEMFPDRHGLPLDWARQMCDQEGDGHFVYYEPRDPATGSTFVQITREPAPRSIAAAA